MPEHSDKPPSAPSLQDVVARKRRRRLAKRQHPGRTIWFGLGMFGLVGWSVAIPALIGVAIGMWIDFRRPSQYSWTLMLMLMGVALGCLNAWRWVHRESEIGKPPDSEGSEEQKKQGEGMSS